jgi:hypothetical protein
MVSLVVVVVGNGGKVTDIPENHLKKKNRLHQSKLVAQRGLYWGVLKINLEIFWHFCCYYYVGRRRRQYRNLEGDHSLILIKLLDSKFKDDVIHCETWSLSNGNIIFNY